MCHTNGVVNFPPNLTGAEVAMKLRQFLGQHAEKSLGKKTWSALDLAKSIAREGSGDQAFQATGRGPGSGPNATSYNVTKLLLAALADVPHPDAPKAVFELYRTLTEGSESGVGSLDDGTTPELRSEANRCGLTNQVTFGEAVMALLDNPRLAARVKCVEVRRGVADASIYWHHNGEERRSRFVTDYDRARVAEEDQQGVFRAVSSIGGAMLCELANDLAGG